MGKRVRGKFLVEPFFKKDALNRMGKGLRPAAWLKSPVSLSGMISGMPPTGYEATAAAGHCLDHHHVKRVFQAKTATMSIDSSSREISSEFPVNSISIPACLAWHLHS